MLGERNTKEELLTAFHKDVQWWRTTVGYFETEVQFMEQLLRAKQFKENAPNLFERLQQFKQEIGTRRAEIKNLKKELELYEDSLQGILECQDISCDIYYLENHKGLKMRFQKCYTNFNTYKAGVFAYIEGVL